MIVHDKLSAFQDGWRPGVSWTHGRCTGATRITAIRPAAFRHSGHQWALFAASRRRSVCGDGGRSSDASLACWRPGSGSLRDGDSGAVRLRGSKRSGASLRMFCSNSATPSAPIRKKRSIDARQTPIPSGREPSPTWRVGSNGGDTEQQRGERTWHCFAAACERWRGQQMAAPYGSACGANTGKTGDTQ